MKKIYFIVISLCLTIAIFFITNGFKNFNLFGLQASKPKQETLNIKPLKDRKHQGTLKLYYDNGQLKSEIAYRLGLREGLYRIFYENGQLKVEGTYRADKMHGLFKRYNNQGQQLAEEMYEDNVLLSRKLIQP